MEILALNFINVVYIDKNGLPVFTFLQKDLFALDTKKSLHEVSESKAKQTKQTATVRLRIIVWQLQLDNMLEYNKVLVEILQAAKCVSCSFLSQLLWWVTLVNSELPPPEL